MRSTPKQRPAAGRTPESARLAELAAENARLRALAARWRGRALRDSLTGLYNRRYLDEMLAHHFRLAQRRRSPATLVIFDLDRFKRINDTHGHPAGDRVLRQFAAVLRRVTRTSDLLARYGGDEVAALLPDTPGPAAVPMVRRVWTAVRAHPFRVLNSLRLDVRCSAGLADSAGLGSEDGAAVWIQRADQALYHAKRAGGDRWSFGG